MKTGLTVSHIGLDAHKAFSKVTARNSENRIVWRQRLDHRDRNELREQLRSWPEGTPVVLEATFGWGWLSNELQFAGLNPHLANCGKVAAWRKARGLAKSDRKDADLLSELWLQEPRWWEVWLPPQDVRDQREWLRYRMTLVRSQTGLKNRVHAILHRHGILHEHSDLFGGQGRRFLNLLVSSKDRRMPEIGRATLKGYLQMLDHIRRQIAGATREVRKQLVKTVPGQRMRTLPGIDWILAYTIVAEVGRIERFSKPGHLVSYSLLAPMSKDSGIEDEKNQEKPIGRHVGLIGRRTLKWAWIEAAHGAVRKGGQFRQTFDRRTNNGERDRNRGYIAVAHQLCRIAYVLWKKDVDYTEDPPERPGRRASQISRPGTGQPDHPMAVVVS